MVFADRRRKIEESSRGWWRLCNQQYPDLVGSIFSPCAIEICRVGFHLTNGRRGSILVEHLTHFFYQRKFGNSLKGQRAKDERQARAGRNPRCLHFTA